MTARLAVPTNPELLSACRVAWEAHGSDVFTWRLSDGAEVARIGLRLLVAEPDGRVLRQEDLPSDVSVKELVTRLRGMRRVEA